MQRKSITSLTIFLIALLIPILNVYGQCDQLSITLSNPGTQCIGSSVYFETTVSPDGDENLNYYTWYKNNAVVQQGSGLYNYTTSTLVNGDQIKCSVRRSTGSCAALAPVMSNVVTLSITTPPTPSVSVEITSGTTFCAGDVVYFVAVTNGNLSNFQWRLDGVPKGTNSTSFSTNQFSSGNVVTVSATATTCLGTQTVTGTTSGMTIVSKPKVVPSVTITSDMTMVCKPSTGNVTYTAAPINGGTSPTYQWQVNGANVGGATGNNKFIRAITGISNGDVVKVILIPRPRFVQQFHPLQATALP